MGHRADIPHIIRKGVLHLGCARALGISLGVLTLSATISTTVGNQEAVGLFALPSSLYRRCEGVSDPKPINIFNENRFFDTGCKSRLQNQLGTLFFKKFRLFLPSDITGSFSDTATCQRIVRAA